MTEPSRQARRALAVLAVTGSALVQPPAVAGQEGPLPPATCRPADSRTPVLLVGTYHMANPGLDQFNLEADEITAPRRQAEVERVAASLARFRPTVVAVEARSGSRVNEDYAAYQRGDGGLRPNEVDQIGFRVAAASGLPRVEPIDVRVSLPDSLLASAAAADPSGSVGRRLADLNAFGEEAIRTLGEWLQEGTVGDMLYRMNTPAALAWANRPYVDHLLGIRHGAEFAGAAYVAEWHRRNLAIFVNLLETVRGPEERVFVVYGQGHIPMLRSLVTQHPALCVEDPLPYLTEAR